MNFHEIKKYGFYVYLHKSKINGHVFYVGKGCGDRAWSSHNRNKFWKSCVSKHGINIEIIEFGLQEWAAFELEESLIALYGRKDLGYGRLCNHTDGNDGNLNPNKESREKISRIQQMRMEDGKHQFLSEKCRANRLKSITGDANPSKRHEVRALISKSKIGKLNPMYGKRGIDHGKSKPVICINNGNEFASASLAGEWIKSVKNMESKRQASKITSVCRGERKNAYGMQWKFKDTLEIT